MILGSNDDLKRQAELTFAMGRHALLDLVIVFRRRPSHPHPDRLPSEDFLVLRSAMSSANTPIRPELLSEVELKKLRAMYEPYAHSLCYYFLMRLPPWIPQERKHDNWQGGLGDQPALVYIAGGAFRNSTDG